MKAIGYLQSLLINQPDSLLDIEIPILETQADFDGESQGHPSQFSVHYGLI